MAINKVVYDGNTLVDLTGDNVTPDALAEGVIAHNAAGEEIVGTMKVTASNSTQVTLLSTGWTEQSNGRYTQTVAVDFMTADAPVVSVDVYMSGADPDADDTMEAAYLGNIYRMTQGAGTVTFWARSVPDVNIQVSVGVS